ARPTARRRWLWEEFGGITAIRPEAALVPARFTFLRCPTSTSRACQARRANHDAPGRTKRRPALHLPGGLEFAWKPELPRGRSDGCGGWILTTDLWVMSPTSYQTAPPRVIILHQFFSLWRSQAATSFVGSMASLSICSSRIVPSLPIRKFTRRAALYLSV